MIKTLTTILFLTAILQSQTLLDYNDSLDNPDSAASRPNSMDSLNKLRPLIDSLYICPKSSYFIEASYAHFKSTYPHRYYFQNNDNLLESNYSDLINDSICNLSGFNVKIGRMFSKYFFVVLNYSSLSSSTKNVNSNHHYYDTTLNYDVSENLSINKYGIGIGFLVKGPHETFALKLSNSCGLLSFRDNNFGTIDKTTNYTSMQAAFHDTLSYNAFYYEPHVAFLLQVYHKIFISAQCGYTYTVFDEGTFTHTAHGEGISQNESMSISPSPPINAGGFLYEFAIGYSFGTYRKF